MKLLHVSPSMDPKHGGVCQAVRIIISGLTELGVQNEIVSLDTADSPFIKNDPFTVNALGVANGPWAYNANLIPWLANNLSRFDAVIVHGLWLYYGYGVRKSMERLNTKSPKLFVMPHGMLDPYFQRAPGRKIKAIRNYLYWKLIENKLVNRAEGLLFTCEEECRLAREPFRPYKPKGEFVVGLGAEQPPTYNDTMREAFYDKLPELRNVPYILFLSRVHEKKGVDLLIKAYGALATGNVRTALPKLVVAGPGLETTYGIEMQRLAYETLGLKGSVFFPGMMTGDVKWGAFYGCQAFILPSHQENFGIAVIEALACGKAVLISNQVNIWREIEKASGGIVENDTLEGTQLMLSRWINFREEEKISMGKKARECFKATFEKGPAAKQFLRVVEN
jgi:glycosyltransferase involved in cell wall biosynthesis